MSSVPKAGRLIGQFIRTRREALGLSQRALGQLFTPTVTTQFISNIERGVTPLPPIHVGTLSRALGVAENELLALLEKEFSAKLSGRMGRPEDIAESSGQTPSPTMMIVQASDAAFMQAVYSAYRGADEKTRQAFATVCESMLGISRANK